MSYVYWIYYGIFTTIPIILGFLTAIIVGAVGKTVLKPDKLVRTIFPYIRRSGDNTVAFGYILKENHINKLFKDVCIIVFSAAWTFFTNILIQYSGNNNPYAGSSIEVKCLFYEETARANSSLVEQPEICFAINLNLITALGQATSALASTWLILSMATWMKLNTDTCKNDKYKCYMCCCKYVRPVLICCFFIIVLMLSAVLHHFQKELAVLVPNLMIAPILLSTLTNFDTNIEEVEEPKTLQAYCEEELTKKVFSNFDQKSKHMLLVEMATLEFKRSLASRYFETKSDQEIKTFSKTYMKKLPYKIKLEQRQNKTK